MALPVRGVALLLVLWLLVLLTGVVSVFALTARTESLQGTYFGRHTTARYAAEAGVEVAVMRMQSSDDSLRWVADGRRYDFGFEQAGLQVKVFDESGKIDLNVAGPDLISGLLLALDVDPQRAQALTGAILDWRDPDDLLAAQGGAEDPEYEAAGLKYGAKDRPFDTVPELQQVLGMDPDLYARLAPYLTVYSGLAQPNARFASEPVLRAMALPAAQIAQLLAQRAAWDPSQPAPDLLGGDALAPQGTGTYSISSHARLRDGTQTEVTATVRLGPSGGFGQLYTPLAWREGETN
jgi:general secretion pathway protein K